ncbi:MAG: arsenic resistance N-acetyltransferase ArsN2 [Thermodesulfobacteriota bacterium]
MAVEFASPGDEPWIRQLLISCGLPQEDLHGDHFKHFLVYKEKGLILGVVGLEIFGKVALLRSLAVNGPHRNRGIASQMVAKIEEYARSLQISKLYLLTTSAEEFFAKRGYQRSDRKLAPLEIRTTREFQEICPDSSVCLSKDLGGSP